MKKLSIEQVIKLHTQIVELTGGTDGVREIGLQKTIFKTTRLSRKQQKAGRISLPFVMLNIPR